MHRLTPSPSPTLAAKGLPFLRRGPYAVARTAALWWLGWY